MCVYMQYVKRRKAPSLRGLTLYCCKPSLVRCSNRGAGSQPRGWLGNRASGARAAGWPVAQSRGLFAGRGRCDWLQNTKIMEMSTIKVESWIKTNAGTRVDERSCRKARVCGARGGFVIGGWSGWEQRRLTWTITPGTARIDVTLEASGVVLYAFVLHI